MKNSETIWLILFMLFMGGALLAQQENEIKVGSLAPEIRLPSPQGDTVTLSSMRGNLVLIDFWASWCAPCVMEQPELKKLYAKYKDTGGSGGKFEIFGVSLDNKKEAWLKVIRKFNIPWTQVSDLKFWTSPVAKTYDLQELPYNFLIDGQGIVVARNLHGKELEHFIDSHINR